MPRKSKGRQRIDITKMSKESNLLVTFSKRRSGLFKKASELCTLCSIEIAIIVFSPAKKVFSFGHPSVDSIVRRFLTRNPSSGDSNILQLVEAHRNANLCELNTQLTKLVNELEEQKKRGNKLTTRRKESQGKCWWESPIEELELEALERLKVAMEELKNNVVKQVEKTTMEELNLSPYFRASSSTGCYAGHALDFP